MDVCCQDLINMPELKSQEQLEFEERLFKFYEQVKDHAVKDFIPALPPEIIERFKQVKKKLGIKDTL